MAEPPLIQVEAVSKKFCRHLKRSLWYGLRDVARELAGRPRNPHLRRDEFWAVDQVSLTVRRGEILGLIGPNGSGKTTMLRLINGLITPDRGRIAIRGRVGALIQLGAGFSPILSGRENIFINAAVLGIANSELKPMLEEIIDFANIGPFIDAPVRTYSSGMRARLGFAVAIHMKPDILLVDEVLAVGDLVFRNKALEKMLTLANSGVAVVYVSHNLDQVDRLCSTAVYLNRGEVVLQAPTTEVIARYARDNSSADDQGRTHYPGTEHFFRILDAAILDGQGRPFERLPTGAAATVRLTLEAVQPMTSPYLCLFIEPQDRSAIVASVVQSRDPATRASFDVGRHEVTVHLPNLPLLPGMYRLRLSVHDGNEVGLLGRVTNVVRFQMAAKPDAFVVTNQGSCIDLEADWRHDTQAGQAGTPRP